MGSISLVIEGKEEKSGVDQTTTTCRQQWKSLQLFEVGTTAEPNQHVQPYGDGTQSFPHPFQEARCPVAVQHGLQCPVLVELHGLRVALSGSLIVAGLKIFVALLLQLDGILHLRSREKKNTHTHFRLLGSFKEKREIRARSVLGCLLSNPEQKHLTRLKCSENQTAPQGCGFSAVDPYSCRSVVTKE